MTLEGLQNCDGGTERHVWPDKTTVETFHLLFSGGVTKGTEAMFTDYVMDDGGLSGLGLIRQCMALIHSHPVRPHSKGITTVPRQGHAQ